ncbi:VOC family protein [Corynebacterium sp.]|uniref:VOC family protein n=1 Tax=Corynebacterium sp. TaxID=1720 RepID=UPI003B3BA150
MNTTRQVQITVDCREPAAVAEFWKATLGYVDPPVPPGFDSWEDFDASLPEADRGSAWACQDPEDLNESCLVMQDVEGNEFCLD